MPEDGPEVPSHSEIAADLRTLREKGLIRLRRLDLPALGEAARAAGFDPAPDPGSSPRAVERLVRAAAAALGEEEPGLATSYLFGLVQGTVGQRPTDLRHRAADVYGLSPETFRKNPERLLIDRLAEEILLLCREPEPSVPRASAATTGSTPDAHPSPARTRAALTQARAQLRRTVSERAEADRAGEYWFGRYGPFPMPFGSTWSLITVDLGAVEELRDVDIVVSSENTYLDPARPFTTTLSGQLRNAAARRDESGSVTYDVVAEELAGWMRKNARPGNPVEPGVVVPTSSGMLAEQGIRVLFHAAVASPRRGVNGYDVPGGGVLRAVHRCFVLGREQRELLGEPLRSITIPLFGAGDGGLDAEASFARLWPAVRDELTADPSWHVHLTTWTPAEVECVLNGLEHSLDPEGAAAG